MRLISGCHVDTGLAGVGFPQIYADQGADTQIIPMFKILSARFISA